MSTGIHYRINLTSSEQTIIKQLVSKHTTAQAIVKRAQIILMANEEGASNRQIADHSRITEETVTLWTRRWIERFLEPVQERLADMPRSGRPNKITPEQWCKIMVLACQPPETYGRPITHWSSRELADEAIKQGIVEDLSAGYLRKILKGNTLQHTAAAIG